MSTAPHNDQVARDGLEDRGLADPVGDQTEELRTAPVGPDAPTSGEGRSEHPINPLGKESDFIMTQVAANHLPESDAPGTPGAGKCTQGFAWCDPGPEGCGDDHGSVRYVRASLGRGAPYQLSDHCDPLSIGAGIRFNQHDGDAAPAIIVHIQGGSPEQDAQVDLTLAEADNLLLRIETAMMDAAATTLELIPKHYREIELPDIKVVAGG